MSLLEHSGYIRKSQLCKSKRRNKFERQFILIKPAGVQRGLIGNIIKCLERRGLKLVGMKMSVVRLPNPYKSSGHHINSAQIENYTTKGPSIAMVWEGPSAIALTRKMRDITTNDVIHLPDTIEETHEEVNLWFNEEELINYKLTIEDWVV